MKRMVMGLFLVVVVAGGQNPVDLGGSYVLPVESDALAYNLPAQKDPVALLQRQIDSGEVKLVFDERHGYLESVLRNLKVPVSSQVLVFSKTSFQLQRISPATPRALYYNDDVYIGWVQNGDVVEVSAVDPERGGMFYTLDQRKMDRPKFVRRDECLQCHASAKTLGVPGHFVRSVYPDGEGYPLLQAGSFVSDHASPWNERWGGWYVTGTHGGARHMGNGIVKDPKEPDRIDMEAGANLTDLSRRINVTPYMGKGSDVVSLLVLEHQTKLHNLITRVAYETRLAISSQRAMNEALKRPLDEWSDSTRRRVYGPAETLVRYMLFTDEFPMPAVVKGSGAFTTEFAKAGPRDSKGRSLRDFDLQKRLFRYPCSFLVYSEAFDALPKVVKDFVYQRLWEVVSGKEQRKEFARLEANDRTAIREILLETKEDLPEYWRNP